MRDAIAGNFTRDQIQITIVWSPMLPADNEAAAVEAQEIFNGHPDVAQFWDPDRRAGTAFRRGVFPDAAQLMATSLPDDHFFMPSTRNRANDQPEWDIYMFFDPGAQWTDVPPTPARWLRQVARFGTDDGRFRSLMWKDRYDAAPIEGQPVEQLESMARELLESGAVPLPPAIELLVVPECPLSPTMQNLLREAMTHLELAVRIDQVDLTTLLPGDARLGFGSPTVLIDGRDLFGSAPSESRGPTCRLYLQGLPDAATMAALLSRAVRADNR